jgi:Zn-dependent peptidase ImmA (M78 family)
LNLRNYARLFRNTFGLTEAYLDVIGLLVTLPRITKVLLNTEVNADVISDYDWHHFYNDNDYAFYNLKDKVINLKESVYMGAESGNGRDRFTITHEIAHVLLLNESTIQFCRSETETVPKYRNPEWQADCLAGELLMPYDFCRNLSIEDIMNNCQVSKQAAQTQYKFYHLI